jgi:predicted DNA-binding antitoxin AbrB/MazE fold protein
VQSDNLVIVSSLADLSLARSMYMPVIHAVYENGVFRPKEPVDLPESSEVEVELRIVTPSGERQLDAIYALLGARFESGENDVAARHDEHQP